MPAATHTHMHAHTGYVVLLCIDPTNNLAILFPVAALFGLGDAAANTQLSAVLGFLFRAQVHTSLALPLIGTMAHLFA
jgi:hypothetical protein